MRKIILYIAASADGKIARQDGSVDWLNTIPNPENTDYGYARFYESVDTTIMGNSTFRQILDFDVPFPYAGKKNYVLTRQQKPEKHPQVTLLEGKADFFHTLKSKPGRHIWLIGGAKTNAWFLDHDLIDELYLFTMPLILGKGIPLFDGIKKPVSMKLLSTKSSSSGVLLLQYRFYSGVS